jgi:hypothetical protein
MVFRFQKLLKKNFVDEITILVDFLFSALMMVYSIFVYRTSSAATTTDLGVFWGG